MDSFYHSTRSKLDSVTSKQAILRGIAPDGGLYICDPAKLDFDWQGALRLDTLSMAAKILSALLPDFPHMEDIVRRSYDGKFPTADLTPLVPVGDKYVLELYHGPTSAFKDVALSVLPRLIGAAARAEGPPSRLLRAPMTELAYETAEDSLQARWSPRLASES